MPQSLHQLAALITRDRDALLSQWRTQVRHLPSATHLDTPALNDHVPALLDELATAFRMVSDETIPEALLAGSPPVHGSQRHQDGYDIVEVVAEYNILRGCIHDLAEANQLSLEGKAFHILNRVFDEAIGLAVQTFATSQALEVQRRREEYLAFVAHDLRTPLNAISLAARVLERTSPDQGDLASATKMLRTLHRNVLHLEALVEKVLKETGHIQSESGVSLERREFDMWPLVEALLHDMRPMGDTSNVELANEVPVDLRVYADAGVLRRILQNLVSNAIKYAPRGRITIAATQTIADGSVECSVSDNGAGIPVDRLQTIFEKLESDPQKEGGVGLGLAIVKSFVEAHGGQVTVESTESVGSTFRFTLPGRGSARA